MTYYPVDWNSYFPQDPSAPVMDPPPTYSGDSSQYVGFTQQNLHLYQDRASQAYLNIWSDLNELNQLELLELDQKSIQTLKQMEDNAKQGIVSSLLNLVEKILEMFANLALALTAGSATFSFFTFLGGMPIMAGISLMIVGGLYAGRMGCNLFAKLFEHLKDKRIESCFQTSIEEKQLNLLPLKKWMNLTTLTDTEQRLRDVLHQNVFAQQMSGYLVPRAEQITFIQHQLQKIEQFRSIEALLKNENPFSLLMRYLRG